MPHHQQTGTVRIGISGWRYPAWRGKFYPPKLAQRRELEYASRTFSTIEINGTFYSLQRPVSFAQWAAETPDDFVFSLKGSRFITHMKKLRDIDEALANFLAQGILLLGLKLGPILWQFPPNFIYNRDRFESFFQQLPRTTADAAKLSEAHSPRLRGRAYTQADKNRPLRHCVEIRHNSFATPEFIDLLRRHDIGLVIADTVEWPLLFDLTGNFVYCRLHGSEQLYASGYDDRSLTTWAHNIRAWATGAPSTSHIHRSAYASTRPAKKQPRDVYVYFDNDAKVHAPFDAQSLQQKLTNFSS